MHGSPNIIWCTYIQTAHYVFFLKLVASAPGFPHGVIDPVEEIAALGRKYDIPVHVDACLGGFVIAFMDEAGYKLPPFDFRVPGVTSISADTHKVLCCIFVLRNCCSLSFLFLNVVWLCAKRNFYFALRSSQISPPAVLRCNRMARRHLRFPNPGWITTRRLLFHHLALEKLYTSKILCTGLIAACWASMMYYGRNGYVEATRKLMQTLRYIEQGYQQFTYYVKLYLLTS